MDCEHFPVLVQDKGASTIYAGSLTINRFFTRPSNIHHQMLVGIPLIPLGLVGLKSILDLAELA